MHNEELATQMWIDENLGVTTGTMPIEMARRFIRLMMRDYQSFYRLAIYGFVMNRRQQGEADSFPEAEFLHFCGEFVHKLEMIRAGKVSGRTLPMFQLVGRKSCLDDSGEWRVLFQHAARKQGATRRRI